METRFRFMQNVENDNAVRFDIREQIEKFMQAIELSSLRQNFIER